MITSRMFKVCCYSTLACLILDVASVIGIVYRDKLPAYLPEFICKTYVAFLVVVAGLAAIYVATGVAFHLPYYKRVITAYTIFSILIIGLIYAMPITINENAERTHVWTSGPSTIVTYCGVFALIVLNLVQIFRHKQYIYERQRKTVLLWMYIWITAAVIQALYNHLLIVGFAGALSMLLIFIQFENPEIYLDRSTGLFNYTAYTRYGEQLYSDKRSFYVIAVVFENSIWQEDMLQSSLRNVEAQETYNAFLKIPGANVFKIQENEIFLFFSKKKDEESAWENILNQMNPEYTDSLLSHPSFYRIENPRCVNSPIELLELLRFVSKQRNSTIEGIFHVVDDKTVSKMFAETKTTQMIMDALSEDRLVVHYQPIYSVEKKRFTSAEALVRIIDRDGRLIPPGEFIQAAETNGMIIEIGKRVFEKACRFFQDNKLDEYGMEYIEVNLSVVQCVNSKLADDYISIMETAKMSPCHVNLEITESTSSHAKRTMIANMDRMIDYGVNFSLDDFGTGASNLNYIVDMPVRIVKFDRGMLQAYFASGKAKYVMDAAMHMIHGMGLEIVAEGVETEEQYRKMEEIKINYIQGFYFSKPLPENEFMEFIRQNNCKV